MQGVYEIRNTVTGDFYIGKSNAIEKRWFQHIHELEQGCHVSQRFQSAWETYGPNVFTFKVLEIIPDAGQCTMQEAMLIETLQPAYNVRGTLYAIALRHARALHIKAQRAERMIKTLPPALPLHTPDTPTINKYESIVPWLYAERNQLTFGVGEVAVGLGISKPVVEKLCERGAFPGALRFHGSGWRIPQSGIVDFLDKNVRGGTPSRDCWGASRSRR